MAKNLSIPGGNSSLRTVFTVSSGPENSGKMQMVPLHTEARILTLCAEAIAAKDESDVERIIADLRAALTEHIQYAKSSLGAQASVIAGLRRHSQIVPTEER